MSTEAWTSLTTMFFQQARRLNSAPLTRSKRASSWQVLTWSDAAKQVATLAQGLRDAGIKRGDRVILVSENRPEWLIADLAIMAAGAISVPTYTTYTASDYLHIAENSQAAGAIVSTKALAKTFLKAAHESDEMQTVITIEKPGISQSLNIENLLLWDEVMASAKPDLEALEAEAKALSRDDIACLIYTSGTGGAPKGVKLHHGAILTNCEGAREVLRPLGLSKNSFLSFLPLSHAYEHTAGQFLPLMVGADIWYAESIEKLAANMAEARPTIMVVVPRLFEMLRLRLVRQIAKEGGLKAKLFDRALSLGKKRLTAPQSMSLFEKLVDRVLEKLVRAKVRQRFGGRLKALVSGGAPLAPDVGYFFASLGLPLLQGYGQTEAGPVISVNPSDAPLMHTVGKPLQGVEVKIADDGEILVRGECVMKGYWRDEAATKRTVKDGWLYTGDIGRLDAGGYLEITDRKKDIIVNDKGDNVSPQRIEGLLSLEEEIAQAMICGDAKPYLSALVVPDPEWLRDWAKQAGKPGTIAELKDDKDFRKALDAAVSRVNARLANVEKVRKISVLEAAFSVENGMMTPTLKVRRHRVKEAYRDLIDGMY